MACGLRSLFVCASTESTTTAVNKYIDINKVNQHDKDDFSELNFNLQFTETNGNGLLVDCKGL